MEGGRKKEGAEGKGKGERRDGRESDGWRNEGRKEGRKKGSKRERKGETKGRKRGGTRRGRHRERDGGRSTTLVCNYIA